MDTKQTTTNTAAPRQQQRNVTFDFTRGSNTESEVTQTRTERPYRARGEARGNYRGRNFQNNEDGTPRVFRGRGRGYQRDYQGQNTENNENAIQSSDNFYKEKPQYNREGQNTPYRGRGEFRGRGDRGGRGRGGYRNWEEARPVQEAELGSDEEIIDVSEEQMKFIKEWQAYSHKNIKVLSDEQIVRVCVDFDFNEAKIQQYLKTYETEDKYKGLADFEWNTIQTRQDKEIDRKKKAAYAERQKLRAEQDLVRAQRKAEAEARRIEREEKDKARNEKKAELAKQKAEKLAEKERLAAEAQQQVVEEQPTPQVESTEVESEVVVTAAPVGESQKPKREKKERKPREDKKQGKVIYKAKVKSEEVAVGPTETTVAETEQVEQVVEQVAEVVKQVEQVNVAEHHQEDKPAKKEKKEKKQKEHHHKEHHHKHEEKVETPAQVVQPTAAPQFAIPHMPQMPMMNMMPMNYAGLPAEGMTIEQQNLFNQQIIIQQQIAIQQYHQQLMQFYVLQQQANGGVGVPSMPMMFGFPQQQPPRQ